MPEAEKQHLRSADKVFVQPEIREAHSGRIGSDESEEGLMHISAIACNDLEAGRREAFFAAFRSCWRNRHIEFVDHWIGGSGASEQRYRNSNRSGMTLRSAVEIARTAMEGKQCSSD